MERIEKDWRLHHPIQATLRDWRKGLSDSLDGMTEWMKDDPNWAYIKGFGDAAFGILGDATFGAVEFGVDLAQYTHEGLTFGYNSLMGKETPQWMKDDLEGGKNALGEALLNTLGTAYGLVTMIPEVNDLINALDDSTRDGSLMGSILHDARHAKDLKQQPIRDKIELAGQFSGYESGQAAGEIISEIVSFIGPAKLAKIAGKSKLVSRLSQVPKIEKGLSYIKQARTMLSDNYLSTLARESYGATKDFFRSRLGNLWDDFSRKKLSPVGLDDFRYGEDIGKHTARFYQSTGESAEYQSILRDLYGDASEQSGRKVGREFSRETSEQLAKHSDDVLKGFDDSDWGSNELGKLREKWNVPETDTIAVGKTDVPGLEGKVFEGGSPKVRKEAGLPDLDDAFPDREIRSSGKISSATRHAEENVANDFINAIKEVGLEAENVTGTFKIHQSNPKGVCPTCLSGLGNPAKPSGVIKQLSEMFPKLRIEVTSEVVEGVKVNGRLQFIVENGKYVKN